MAETEHDVLLREVRRQEVVVRFLRLALITLEIGAPEPYYTMQVESGQLLATPDDWSVAFEDLAHVVARTYDPGRIGPWVSARPQVQFDVVLNSIRLAVSASDHAPGSADRLFYERTVRDHARQLSHDHDPSQALVDLALGAIVCGDPERIRSVLAEKDGFIAGIRSG